MPERVNRLSLVHTTVHIRVGWRGGLTHAGRPAIGEMLTDAQGPDRASFLVNSEHFLPVKTVEISGRRCQLQMASEHRWNNGGGERVVHAAADTCQGGDEVSHPVVHPDTAIVCYVDVITYMNRNQPISFTEFKQMGFRSDLAQTMERLIATHHLLFSYANSCYFIINRYPSAKFHLLFIE